MMFSENDARWLSGVLLRLHSCAHEHELHECLLPPLHSRFSSVVSQIEEVAFDVSSYRRPMMLASHSLPADHLPAMHDSPIVLQGLRRGWPRETVQLSAIVGNAALSRTSFYNVVMKYMGFEDQLLGVAHAGSGCVWSFGVNRDGRFTPKERILFDHIRHHAEARLLSIRRSLSAVQPLPVAEITLGRDRVPQALPHFIRRLLCHYYPESRREVGVGRLPLRVREWIDDSLKRLGSIPLPLTCLRTEAARGHLVIRLFPGRPDDTLLLRLAEDLRVPDPYAAVQHGLTERECEVLHWLREGKRDGEIALILSCARRTVENHVSHILHKLRAKSRVEAVNRVFPWLRRPYGTFA